MNAKAWFNLQSFNGRIDSDEPRKHKIVHLGTGNLVCMFNSREDAEKWLRSYGVSQQYKDQNYKIVVV